MRRRRFKVGRGAPATDQRGRRTCPHPSRGGRKCFEMRKTTAVPFRGVFYVQENNGGGMEMKQMDEN